MGEAMKIAALYRHPVKSLLGEQCETLMLDQRGVVGDRLFALVDEEERLGSHKNSRRFRKMPGLFDLQGVMQGDQTAIQFPDGSVLPYGAADMDARLSAHTGKAVTLCKEATVSHFDDSPIHLITTAGLQWLHDILPGAGIDARRFRPNIVVDCPRDSGGGPVEHSWVGKRLTLGVCEIEITMLTERCVMTTLAQHGLPKAPEVLKALADKAGVNFGVYAKIVTTGTLRVGDPVTFA